MNDEFRELHERVGPRIVAYARRRLTTDAALDVLQETFEVIWRKREQMPADPDAAAAWAFGIAKMKVLQSRQMRHRRPHDHRFVEDYSEAAADAADVAGMVTEAVQARSVLRELTPEEMRLFKLVYLSHHDRNAIAVELDITVGALNTRVCRLRGRLVRLLDRAAEE